MRLAMSCRELNRHYFIRLAVEGKMTVAQTADQLKLSHRRVKQLKKAFRALGPTACIHGNAIRPSPKRTDPLLVEKILDLRKQDTLKQSNFIHFQEILKEHYDIDIPYSTLRRILISNGYHSPMGKRRSVTIHKTRERRPAFGMMLQADASPFDWLSNGSSYALHGMIDDATGTVTGLYLCSNECLLGYLETTRQTLSCFGIPQALYSDRGSVFFVNAKQETQLSVDEQLAGETEKRTQFGRIMHRLGVEMIKALSPQAKGRIERLWGTLQSRLPVEFSLHGITTIEEANAFLRSYLPQFNAQFAVPPAETYSAFVPLPHTEDLDRLLSVALERKLSAGSTVSVNHIRFKIEQDKFRGGSPVTLLLSEKHGLRALISGEFYPIFPLDPVTYSAEVVRTGNLPVVFVDLIRSYLLKDAHVA